MFLLLLTSLLLLWRSAEAEPGRDERSRLLEKVPCIENGKFYRNAKEAKVLREEKVAQRANNVSQLVKRKSLSKLQGRYQANMTRGAQLYIFVKGRMR